MKPSDRKLDLPGATSTDPHDAAAAPAENRRGVVLALGGGFSRGFAHLGILEVLQTEGVRVDAIVGTSIGGLLGAAFADGISLRTLCELGRRVRVRDFLRFRPREQGAPRKDCIGGFVREWFRAQTLEELRIPTAIVTTDLDTCAPHVLTQGPIEPAIRATCAFPGLVRPVRHQGYLLADGCLAAPVPAEIAARMHGGCVLAVNVGATATSAPSAPHSIRAFDPAPGKSQGGAAAPAWSRHANLFIEPTVHHIDWNDFTRVDEAFFAGADAMRRALPNLRALLGEMSPSSPILQQKLPEQSSLAL